MGRPTPCCTARGAPRAARIRAPPPRRRHYRGGCGARLERGCGNSEAPRAARVLARPRDPSAGLRSKRRARGVRAAPRRRRTAAPAVRDRHASVAVPEEPLYQVCGMSGCSAASGESSGLRCSGGMQRARRTWGLGLPLAMEPGLASKLAWERPERVGSQNRPPATKDLECRALSGPFGQKFRRCTASNLRGACVAASTCLFRAPMDFCCRTAGSTCSQPHLRAWRSGGVCPPE